MPNRLPSSGSPTTIFFIFLSSIRRRTEKDTWPLNRTTGEEPRNKVFQMRGKRLFQRERFSTFIDRGGAKLTPIQILNPKKTRSHLENFSKLKRQDINCCSLWFLSSRHQDPKGCQLLISRSKVNQHASCQPAAQFSHHSKRSTLMNQIFFYLPASKSRHR